MADFQNSQRYHSNSEDSSDCENSPPPKKVCLQNIWILSKSFHTLQLAKDYEKSLQHFTVTTVKQPEFRERRFIMTVK